MIGAELTTASLIRLPLSPLTKGGEGVGGEGGQGSGTSRNANGTSTVARRLAE
jgi:hypothetical protein